MSKQGEKSLEVISNALSYVGERETKGNSGFINPDFEKEMKEEGWQHGWAWCCVFAKVVFLNVFPEHRTELNKLFSPSCITTLNNAKKMGFPILTLPVPGSLMIMQMMKNGVPQATGHAGIPIKLNSSWEFESVEGNSAISGSREGTDVIRQPNRKTIKDVWDGLKVVGFIDIVGYYDNKSL